MCFRHEYRINKIEATRACQPMLVWSPRGIAPVVSGLFETWVSQSLMINHSSVFPLWNRPIQLRPEIPIIKYYKLLFLYFYGLLIPQMVVFHWFRFFGPQLYDVCWNSHYLRKSQPKLDWIVESLIFAIDDGYMFFFNQPKNIRVSKICKFDHDFKCFFRHKIKHKCRQSK